MAGEGIWLRHLRTSAGGGGREGRAGELAQAAGTTGAHGPCSPVPFPVWPQPWASPGAECKRGRLHLTFPFAVHTAPAGEQTGPEGKASFHFLSLCWVGGPVCPPLRSRVGPEPREEDTLPSESVILVLGGSPEPTPPPSSQARKQAAPISFGKGVCREASGTLQSTPSPPRVFPAPSLPPVLLPPLRAPPDNVRGTGGGGTTNSARLPGEVTCAGP